MAANPTKYNSGSDGRTRQVPAPVFRGNLRSQYINLSPAGTATTAGSAETANFFLYEGSVQDDVFRVFNVAIRAYSASTGTTQHIDTAILAIYNDTPIILDNAGGFITIGNEGDHLRIWYDSTNDRMTITNQLGVGGSDVCEVVITNMTA